MIRSVYPVLMTEKLDESRDFYRDFFGFSETFYSGWYASLAAPGGAELALIDAGHETIPPAARAGVQGMILNIEVDNATEVYRRILEKNREILLAPLRDEAYGQRHFMLQDPNGLLLDVIEMIAPGEEYAGSYTPGGTTP